jgi:hypothetical protein
MPRKTYKDKEHMKPEEKVTKGEEEREEVEGQKKKPYSTPELTKFAPIEDMTEGIISGPAGITAG